MWKGVVTNAGVALLSQWAAGGTLAITKAQGGTGNVGESSMKVQTALVNPVQTLAITNYQTNSTGITYKVQILANTTAYTLKQIGVWGKLGSGAETLIALFEDATGIQVPASADMPDYVLTFSATVQMANSGSLMVTIDSSALVSQSDMKAYVDAAVAGVDVSEITEHIADKNNPHAVTAAQVGAAAASHYHGNITPDGKVGAASGKVLRTGTGGAVQAGAISDLRDEMGLGDGDGALQVANGGTGAATAAGARDNLGAAAKEHAHGAVTSDGKVGTASGKVLRTGDGGAVQAGDVSALRNEMGLGTSGALPVASGGTGAATAAGARDNLGAAAKEHAHGNIKSDGTLDAESGNQVLVANDDKKIVGYDGPSARNLIGAAAADHTHGAIGNDGKVGTASGKVLRTGDGGAVQAGDVSALRNEMGLGTSGALPVASGGTGAATAAGALENLGAAAKEHTHDYLPTTGGTVSGVLYVDPAIRCPSIGAGDAKVLMEENVNGGFYQLIGSDGTTYIIDASLSGVFKVYSNASNPPYWVSFNGKTGDANTNGALHVNGHAVSTADIQIGTASVGTNAVTVTFPRAFAGVPVVTAVGSVPGYIRVFDVTATGFSAASGNSGSTVQWQAIYMPT